MSEIELTDKRAEAASQERQEPRFLTDSRISKDGMGRLTIDARQYEVVKDSANKILGMKHVFDLNVVLGPHPERY